MMADPMADLGAGAPGGPSKNDNTNLTNTKEVTDPMVWGENLKRIDRIRSVMGIASGCVAGILGFTGLQGFCKWEKRSNIGLVGGGTRMVPHCTVPPSLFSRVLGHSISTL
jgi:hypothetical protein